MIQIGLGGWLTCRLWDSMRSLRTVWRIGRSPMEYAMEHSVSRTVVASECSPPPMCGLGRSGDRKQGFWRIAPRQYVHNSVPWVRGPAIGIKLRRLAGAETLHGEMPE